MFVVGLTGGIGSGKTTVLKMFSKLDVPVYVADVEAKRLMQDSSELKANITQYFGENSYVEGKLNRTYLASLVFGDAEKLAVLNKLVHPFVHKDFDRFKSTAKADYIVYESAILLQQGGAKLCDYIVLVSAPLPIRLDRVIKRDHSSIEDVKKRMEHQQYSSEELSKVDVEIENTHLKATEKQVFVIHKYILNLTINRKE